MDADLVLLLHFPGHPIMTSPVAKLLFVMYINHDEYTLLAQARACQTHRLLSIILLDQKVIIT